MRKVLAEHGLSPADLQTPPDLPLDPVEAETYLAAGNVRERITMNCSGKHAAMLAVCVRNGWDTATYLDPAHPLQQLVGQVVAEAAGEPVAAVGTDGCGAPLMAIGLTGLARAFRSFVLAEPGSAERRVADAMRAHPEYVAGTRRPDTWLMREVPGTLSKMGAEAVQAVALADGRGPRLQDRRRGRGGRSARCSPAPWSCWAWTLRWSPGSDVRRCSAGRPRSGKFARHSEPCLPSVEE